MSTTENIAYNIENFPWHWNDIYLEDGIGNVKAVCRDASIAKILSRCANAQYQLEKRNDALAQQNELSSATEEHSIQSKQRPNDQQTDISHDSSNVEVDKATLLQLIDMLKKTKAQEVIGDQMRAFIESAYVLYVLIPRAKIQTVNVETMLLERAFHDFCEKFNAVVDRYHIEIKDKIESMSDQQLSDAEQRAEAEQSNESEQNAVVQALSCDNDSCDSSPLVELFDDFQFDNASVDISGTPV